MTQENRGASSGGGGHGGVYDSFAGPDQVGVVYRGVAEDSLVKAFFERMTRQALHEGQFEPAAATWVVGVDVWCVWSEADRGVYVCDCGGCGEGDCACEGDGDL